MRTVYISGPMAGYPNLGACPGVRVGQKVYGDGRPGSHDGGCDLRADLAALLRLADAVYCLPGWSRSRGAQIEVLIARLLRIPIDYHPDAERGGSAVEVLADVYDEINRQDAKWGDQSKHPDGTQRPSDALVANWTRQETQDAFAVGRGTWRNILDEEVAEAYAETGPELSTELVQVAAVAVQWRAAQARRNQPPKENRRTETCVVWTCDDCNEAIHLAADEAPAGWETIDGKDVCEECFKRRECAEKGAEEYRRCLRCGNGEETRTRTVEPPEVVDLVAALRASVEAARRRREARESGS